MAVRAGRKSVQDGATSHLSGPADDQVKEADSNSEGDAAVASQTCVAKPRAHEIQDDPSS